MPRIFHITLSAAADGLKADITASPSLWNEIADNEGTWNITSDEAIIYLDAPRFRLPGNIPIRLVAVNTTGGSEHVAARPTGLVEWDDDTHSFIPVRDEDSDDWSGDG